MQPFDNHGGGRVGPDPDCGEYHRQTLKDDRFHPDLVKGWVVLGWVGLGWVVLCCVVLCCVVLCCVVLCCVVLGWVAWRSIRIPPPSYTGPLPSTPFFSFMPAPPSLFSHLDVFDKVRDATHVRAPDGHYRYVQFLGVRFEELRVAVVIIPLLHLVEGNGK